MIKQLMGFFDQLSKLSNWDFLIKIFCKKNTCLDFLLKFTLSLSKVYCPKSVFFYVQNFKFNINVKDNFEN